MSLIGDAFRGVAASIRGILDDFTDAHEGNPTNGFFTGGIVVVVVGAAALMSMEVGKSLTDDQWFNFRLSIAAVVAVLVVMWVYRIWVRPISLAGPTESAEGVADQLKGECEAMAAYALERGLEVATVDIAVLEGFDLQGRALSRVEVIDALNLAHSRLARAVHPAMPKTLYLLRRERSSPKVFPWLGPVRLVRMFMILGVLLVPLFVVLGLSVGVTAGDTNGPFFGGNLVERSKVALYLVASATIGSTFAGLTKAFRYIGNLSYDDKYESSYWVRLVLGIVAGLILAVVLSQVFFDEGSESGTGFRITVPLLAVVGGFSSDLVYKILKRVIDALETLVSGSASEQVDTAVAEIEARSRAAGVEQRAAVARQLLKVRDSLPVDAVEAKARLDEALENVLGELQPGVVAVVEEPSDEDRSAEPGDDEPSIAEDETEDDGPSSPA